MGPFAGSQPVVPMAVLIENFNKSGDVNKWFLRLRWQMQFVC